MKHEDMRDAFDIARFGIEVEQFILTPVGKYLLNRAEMDREKAVNDMKLVDPTDANAVRQVQDNLRTPDKIVKWLSEAIEGGRASHDAIAEQELGNE